MLDFQPIPAPKDVKELTDFPKYLRDLDRDPAAKFSLPHAQLVSEPGSEAAARLLMRE